MGRVREFLERKKDGTYIFMKPENIYYLIGNYIPDSVLVVDEEWRLLVPKMYWQEAEEVENALLCNPYKEISKIKEPFLETSAPAWLAEKTNGRVDGTVEEMRMVKSADEIEKIEEAQIETARQMERLIEFLHLGRDEMREIDGKAFFLSSVSEAGLEWSFLPIIASGKNSSRPHHSPGTEVIGDYVLVDVGVRKKWYCGDMTRIILFRKPSDEMEEWIGRILAYFDEIDPEGKELKEIQPEWEMPHSIGHGIGLEVHEKAGKIGKGTAVTIEPAFYSDEWGIRIEDLYIGGKGFISPLPRVIEMY